MQARYVMTTTQSAVRFTPQDLAILEALQEKLGIGSRTDVIRLALRRLAALEQIDVSRLAAKKR
jgi:hypothetical protein